MNILKQIPSCLAVIASIGVIKLPIMGGPIGWHERLLDPATFLMALTLAGVAMLLWPLREQRPTPS
jgi:hypothetical protein